MKGTWELVLLWINSPSRRTVSQLVQIGILRGDNNALVGWYKTMSCDPVLTAISVGNYLHLEKDFVIQCKHMCLPYERSQ